MMYKYKKSILLLLSTVATCGLAINANGASWRITPSIALTETYTDNVDLDDSFSQSDFVTQISPQIAVTGDGSRLSASLLYAPNYFFYPGDDADKHDLRHTLEANLNSELISETFFVEASANIAQRFLDRRQAISSVESNRTDNRRTVQAYRFSPYLMHRIGDLATVQLRYDLSHIRQAADAAQTTLNTFFGNTLGHQGSLTATSGRRFSRLNWTLSASYQSEERENIANYNNTLLRADFSYQVVNMLALLGSVGYQRRNSVGSFTDFDGFIWDAGFRLVPGPRTSLSFRYGNQFNGNTFSLDGRYQITTRDEISLSYSDVIQTFQSQAFDDIGGGDLDPTFNSGFISGDLTRRKRWALNVGGTRGRTSYRASAFYSKNQSDNAALDEKRYGGVISVNRNLNQRLSVSGVFSYNISQFTSDNIEDKFWSGSISTSYRISQSLVGSLRYVHTDRAQARFGNLNGGSNFISLSIRAEI